MSNKPVHSRRRLWRFDPLNGALSRRQFLGTAAGATGLALGSGLLTPGAARAGGCDNVNPNPIPFSQLISGYGPFHTYNVGPADQGLDPSLITDFNGFDGVALLSGSATDGSSNTFKSHFGFMKGVYVGVDGKKHQGAFAFIWMEVNPPGGPPSIHAYDAGYITGYPDGLFWVTAPCIISLDDVVVHFGNGTASLEFNDVAVNDWITLLNSFSDGALVPNTPFPATMSCQLKWSGVSRRISGLSDWTNGFGGNFIISNLATISVSVQNNDGSFSFSGSGDTSSGFAQIGKERNGVFFTGN